MDAATNPIKGAGRIWRARIKRLADLPVNTVSSAMLCLVIAGAPFPFGSRDPSTVAFWVLWLGLAALCASPRGLRKAHALLLVGLLAVIAAYAFILHEQISDHPVIATAHPLWAEASRVLGQAIRPSASIARDAAFYNLGPVAANLLALALGLVVGADRRIARRVLLVAGWAGVAYATYGLFAEFVTPTSVLWQEKEFYVGTLTATFINRNTAATYFGSMAIIWLVVLLEAVRDRLPRGPVRWRDVWDKVILRARIETILPFLCFFICLSALFMTRSRGGVLFSLAAGILAFWLFFHRDLVTRTNRGLAIAVAGLVSLVLLQVLAGVVGDRLDRQGLVDTGRLVTDRATMRMIADRPWFGTGLGTYAWGFPAYRDDGVSMWGVWDMAHCTPLQMAAEVGIPLTLVVAAAWLVALGVLIRAVFVRRRDVIIPLAALAISLIALGHSMIDFSLQVAGYSIVVFGLLGIGLAQAFKTERSRASSWTDPSRARNRRSEKRGVRTTAPPSIPELAPASSRDRSA